jgi:hypothetical protein
MATQRIIKNKTLADQIKDDLDFLYASQRLTTRGRVTLMKFLVDECEHRQTRLMKKYIENLKRLRTEAERFVPTHTNNRKFEAKDVLYVRHLK